MKTITPTSKSELKTAITSSIGGYNYFKGDIRVGNRYARLNYYFIGNKITIQVTYWEDGKDCAVECASNCTTPAGIVNKVSKFLNLK